MVALLTQLGFLQTADVPHKVGSIPGSRPPGIACRGRQMDFGRSGLTFDDMIQADVQMGVKQTFFSFQLRNFRFVDLVQYLLRRH